MDHQSAVDRNLAERYILGELTPKEVAEFEEHFFDCPMCAADIRRGGRFVANLKVEIRSAVSTIEIGPNDHFVELIIPMKTPTTAAVECDCRCGRKPPVVVIASPQRGVIRLQLSITAFSPGPCMVILRDPRSGRELERHQFIIESASIE